MSVDGFFTRLNPLVTATLRSRAHWPLSKGLLLLSFTGRKSGRRFTIPVGYQRDGDVLTVLVSEAQKKRWWRNYREAGPVTVRLRGRERSGTGWVVPPDSDEFRDRAERSLRRVPGLTRVFGVVLDPASGLSPDQLDRLRRKMAIVRIDL